jgi:hypothetical protein
MNRFIKIAITAITALSMWACVDNANSNKPANTNVNSNANATTAKAPPTLDAIMAQEKQANEAYTKGDGQFFQGLLSEKFVMNEMGRLESKADAVKMISGVKCDVKSMSLDEGKLSQIDADNYAVVYKSTSDGTCTFEGKTEKMPSPMRAATVWTRAGDKWQPVWHGETAIVDPKAAPPKAMPPAAKDEKPAPEANANASSNSNSAAAAKPSPDPAVDAIIAVEKSGWEAWKAQDAAKLNSITSSNLSFVGWNGGYTPTQAETVKGWTDGTCKVNSVSVTDASGQMLSPTVGIIFFKGAGDGTCGDMKIQPIWGTSVYVKEGDAWKLAFGFENPA